MGKKKTGKTGDVSPAKPKKAARKDPKDKEEKPGKRINVEIAPGVAGMLKAERDRRNSSAGESGAKTTYADLVNEALDKYLPKLPESGPETHEAI